MRRKNKIYSYALAAIAVTGMTACSNTLDGFGNGGGVAGNGPSLVRSADVIAWSGTETLGTTRANMTRAANVNGNLWYQNWDRPTNVTEEEIAKVLEEASKQRIDAVNDIHIDWNNYWVQQVYTGTATYEDGTGSNIGTGSSHMNHLLAYSSKVNEQTAWYPEPEFTLRDKYSYEDVYEHVNNFNKGSNDTAYTDDETGQEYIGTTLMTDMYAEGIIDQFGYHNSTDSKNHFEYIILEIDGSYYVCFDFYATHPEGQEANKNMDVERDWIFNDWIVKISPAFHVGETPNPDNGNNPDNGDENGDENGDDNNGDVEETPGTPSNPSTPNIPEHRHANEVEVNLSIQDTHNQYDIEDLVTKLSIHVRYPGDVTVRIPVPTKYFVMADDLNIFEAHYLVLDKYGKDHSSSYDINGNIVKLTVNYVDGGQSEGELVTFIVVRTEGINKEVIDYLMDKNGDGINFEVWNYYNFKEYDENGKLISAGLKPTDEQIASLKNILDTSFITFEGEKKPAYYINAFNDTEENPKGVKDCKVTPTKYRSYKENMPHLNGSQYNVIYYFVETPDIDIWHK